MRDYRAAVVVLAATSALASVASAHGDVHQRIDALTARIERSPTDAALYLERGQLRGLDDDWRAAAVDFETAARIDPALPFVSFHLATALLELGEAARAEALLDEHLRAHADHVDGHVVRGRARAAQGRRLDAVLDYDRAIALSVRPAPRHYVERARLLIAEGGDSVDDAVRGLEDGTRRLGPIVTLIEIAIEAEEARGRCANGPRWIARLPETLRRAPRWRAIAGDLHACAGDFGKARREYRAALDALDALPAARRSAAAMVALRTTTADRLDALEREHGSSRAESALASRGARSSIATTLGTAVAAAAFSALATVFVVRRRRR